MTVPKPSFLADLVYYGVENIDESTIVCYHDPAYKCLADIEKSVCEKVRHEIRLWYAYRAIILLAKECATRYLTSSGKLQFDIYGPRIGHHEHEDKILYSYRTYRAFWSLFEGRSEKILSLKKRINTYLSKVGLKVISLNLGPNEDIIHVSMQVIDI